jgi:hypothetical protein
MTEKQKSGVRSQKPEYKAENRFHRFSFILTPDFWILDSAFRHPFFRAMMRSMSSGADGIFSESLRTVFSGVMV